MTQNILFNPSDKDVIALIRTLKPGFILLFTDTNTRKLCLPIFESIISKFKNVRHVTIKAGERFKNFESVQKILDELLSANAGKDALVINLGGGVITDIGGFAASIYKRGISYINVPTTLLAQADAAIGGKTGINAGAVKNSIGTIHQPVATVINTAYLDSLSEKEGLNGLAEIMKHSLLDGGEHWNMFLQFLDGKVKLVDLLKRSVSFKQSVVESDPLDNGYRQILNFGHTVGHALEAYMLAQDKALKHGYAVAFGMKAAMNLSERRFKLQPPGLQQAKDLVDTLFPSVEISENEVPLIMMPMLHDKKIKENKLCFVLLEAIGKPHMDCMVLPKDVERAVLQSLVQQ